MRHAYASTLRRPAHVSHRGGAKVEPENTLLAFSRAVAEFKTDVLELDVHLSRDGVLVVHHDDMVDRCTDGQGAVSSFTQAELSRLDAGFRFSPDDGVSFPRRGQGLGVPSLQEVLRAFPEVRLNIEAKSDVAGIEQVLGAELRGQLHRVCIGSEHDARAARLVSALPDACHFFPRDALTAFVLGAMSDESVVPDERFHVADMPAVWEGMPLITPALLASAKQHGIAVLVWTIDDEAEMSALLDAGVDGVMTDRPDVLRRVLESRR